MDITKRSLVTFLRCGRTRVLAALFLSLTLMGAFGRAQGDVTTPSIEITKVPPISAAGDADTTNPIAGKVSVPAAACYKKVIYAHAGGTWWVQPLADSPLTDISVDGSWQTDSHPGTEYAALLVKKVYKPQAKISSLPQLGGDVVALDKKAGNNPPPPTTAGASAEAASKPKVTITAVPPKTAGGEQTYGINGTAEGVRFSDCKIVVYVHAGGQWWVQPTAAEPLTEIASDGKWQLDTHGGTQYVVVLVQKDYAAAATLNVVPSVGKQILAEDQEDGK
jgi:hypothetical protein